MIEVDTGHPKLSSDLYAHALAYTHTYTHKKTIYVKLGFRFQHSYNKPGMGSSNHNPSTYKGVGTGGLLGLQTVGLTLALVKDPVSKE